MNSLRASASKAHVRLECKFRYEFAKLKAKGQLRSLYRTRYAKVVAGQTSTVSTVQTVAGHSVLVSERISPHLLVRSALGCKLTRSATLKTRQWRTDNLAEVAPQTHMSSQNQGIHATSPDTIIDFFDDAASEAPQHGTLSSRARRET